MLDHNAFLFKYTDFLMNVRPIIQALNEGSDSLLKSETRRVAQAIDNWILEDIGTSLERDFILHETELTPDDIGYFLLIIASQYFVDKYSFSGWSLIDKALMKYLIPDKQIKEIVFGREISLLLGDFIAKSRLRPNTHNEYFFDLVYPSQSNRRGFLSEEDVVHNRSIIALKVRQKKNADLTEKEKENLNHMIDIYDRAIKQQCGFYFVIEY